jgi:hypothetical protein
MGQPLRDQPTSHEQALNLLRPGVDTAFRCLGDLEAVAVVVAWRGGLGEQAGGPSSTKEGQGGAVQGGGRPPGVLTGSRRRRWPTSPAPVHHARAPRHTPTGRKPLVPVPGRYDASDDVSSSPYGLPRTYAGVSDRARATNIVMSALVDQTDARPAVVARRGGSVGRAGGLLPTGGAGADGPRAASPLANHYTVYKPQALPVPLQVE